MSNGPVEISRSRRDRPAMNALKKRDQQAEAQRQLAASMRAAGLPEVRLGGH